MIEDQALDREIPSFLEKDLIKYFSTDLPEINFEDYLKDLI